VLSRLNPFARIPLCGLLSGFDGRPATFASFRSLLVNRVTLRGFIITDHVDLWPTAVDDLSALVADGRLKYRETVVEGLENAPRAFIGMLAGENLGKQLGRV
jgi:NADPH-dependent curcumin reductase CurA